MRVNHVHKIDNFICYYLSGSAVTTTIAVRQDLNMFSYVRGILFNLIKYKRAVAASFT